MAKLPSERARDAVGLPPRPFLYTLDQIAGLLATDLADLKKSHIYFFGKDSGPNRKRMTARNIGRQVTDDWRVEERELLRWLRHKGFHIYEGME